MTQTDIAPSWISAVAMAPAVIEARKGMNMGSFWGGGTEVSGEMKFATESMTSPLNSDAHQGLIARQAVTLNVTVVGNQYLGVAKRSLGYV